MSTVEDTLALQHVLHTYALALDTKSWELLDEVFTDDAVMDFAERGGSHVGRDAVRAQIRKVVDTLDRTQHIITNLRATFADDAASAEATAYYQGQHVRAAVTGEPWNIVAGIYYDRWVRTPEGWRIAYRLLDIIWESGNPEVLS